MAAAAAIAGPLSRFYAKSGDDLARLRVGVETWRSDLVASVPAKVAAELEWNEGSEIATTFDLEAAGWPAVRLFAFYAERTDLEMPDTVPPLLELDSEWRAASEGKFARSLYGQLLACRVWLPGDFPVTMRVPMPDGDTLEVGSLRVLADQLKFLNERTFHADAAEIERWHALPAPAGGELLDATRRGYAGLMGAVRVGLAERVPVIVREP